MIIYIGPIQNDIRPLLSELHSFSTASHRHPWLPPVSARAVTSSRERELSGKQWKRSDNERQTKRNLGNQIGGQHWERLGFTSSAFMWSHSITFHSSMPRPKHQLPGATVRLAELQHFHTLPALQPFTLYRDFTQILHVCSHDVSHVCSHDVSHVCSHVRVILSYLAISCHILSIFSFRILSTSWNYVVVICCDMIDTYFHIQWLRCGSQPSSPSQRLRSLLPQRFL
jgi:hypothetical protein